MLGGIEETSASFEARSAPQSYPTAGESQQWLSHPTKLQSGSVGEAAGDRDVGRISNSFATLYLAGCLAVRFKIFPVTEAEVLEALLTCHRDHVASIDERPRRPAGRRPAIIHGATATTTREPIAGASFPPTPFDRLRRFINGNSRRGFIDLRSPRPADFRFKLLQT